MNPINALVQQSRHGTSTLIAALDVASGEGVAKDCQYRRPIEFPDVMNGIVAAHPDREIGVVLETPNSHKPRQDRWLASHPDVHFRTMPPDASRLNQVECRFSALTGKALRGASLTSVDQIRRHLDTFVETRSQSARPFARAKSETHQDASNRVSRTGGPWYWSAFIRSPGSNDRGTTGSQGISPSRSASGLHRRMIFGANRGSPIRSSFASPAIIRDRAMTTRVAARLTA